MARIVKMCDVTADVAAKIFAVYNEGKVAVLTAGDIGRVTAIVTDVEPKNLIYPDGWYYAKGRFTNKHKSTTGMYDTVLMLDKNGDVWDVPYCTAD